MGIDLDGQIRYIHASMRYFNKGEYHITRYCTDDVLLMVYEGVLRFTENGVEREVAPGQYYIQHHDMEQAATVSSDVPKYLYIHFRADWREEGSVLPAQGTFSYTALKPYMEKLDQLSHENGTLIEISAVFYSILSLLYRQKTNRTIAHDMADYISQHAAGRLSLENMSIIFHYSKNHIIKLFKQEYHMTPFAYVKHLRMQRAEWLLEVTSDSVESIANSCGFRDYSQFYRTFYQKHNMGPSVWRTRKHAM